MLRSRYLGDWIRGNQPLAYATLAILAVMAVLAVLSLLLGPITSLASGTTVHHLSGKEKADAINEVRQTLLQAAAGTAALTALVFTGMTFTLNRRGQVTD